MSRGYNINRYGSQEREEDRRMIPRPVRKPQEKTDAQRISGNGETQPEVPETPAAGRQFGTESGAEE